MSDRWSDQLDQIMTWAIGAILGGVSTGVAWLVRRVFTNQKQIELLQAELRHRERQREEDREQLAEVKKSVDRIEGWIVTGRTPIQHFTDKTIPPKERP